MSEVSIVQKAQLSKGSIVRWFDCLKVQLSEGLIVVQLSEGLIVWKFKYPKVQLSDGSIDRWFNYPKVQLSEGSIVRRFNYPKVQLSEILFIDMNSQLSDYDGLRFFPFIFHPDLLFRYLLDFLGFHSKTLLLLVIQATSNCTQSYQKSVEKVPTYIEIVWLPVRPSIWVLML